MLLFSEGGFRFTADKCWYKHGKGERTGRSEQRDRDDKDVEHKSKEEKYRNTKDKVNVRCNYYLQNRCSYGEDCRFIHEKRVSRDRKDTMMRSEKEREKKNDQEKKAVKNNKDRETYQEYKSREVERTLKDQEMEAENLKERLSFLEKNIKKIKRQKV